MYVLCHISILITNYVRIFTHTHTYTLHSRHTCPHTPKTKMCTHTVPLLIMLSTALSDGSIRIPKRNQMEESWGWAPKRNHDGGHQKENMRVEKTRVVRRLAWQFCSTTIGAHTHNAFYCVRVQCTVHVWVCVCVLVCMCVHVCVCVQWVVCKCVYCAQVHRS